MTESRSVTPVFAMASDDFPCRAYEAKVYANAAIVHPLDHPGKAFSQSYPQYITTCSFFKISSYDFCCTPTSFRGYDNIIINLPQHIEH
ncbi:MAG: hypothetical protein AAGK74_16640, partial [Chloroflexota bacterium]